MRKFPKLGATALALALSLTMVAPLSANAAIITNYDADGKVVSYTNEDTGKTSKHRIDVIQDDSVYTIATKSYNEVAYFNTTADVAKFTNFKSNKKALKVKVIEKDEYTDKNVAEDKGVDYDYDEDGKYYYRNVNGEIVSVESEKYDQLPKGYDRATYTVRLYAKKAGTYKVTYDAVLKSGTTVKKTIKVIAKEDGAAIKSVTFAGKVISESVDSKAPSTNKLWTKNYGYNTTTAKSGKLKVTMNKNFKLKKIEVGTPTYKEVAGTADDYYTKRYTNTSYASDLDLYNGQTMAWKTVKNGKKITLNKTDDTYAQHDYYKDHEYLDKDTSVTTYIRITYYDKKDKETHRAVYTINKVQK